MANNTAENSSLHIYRGNPAKSSNIDMPSKTRDNSSNGGEPPMDKDKYVTHEELELSNEKMLHHIDNQFSNLRQDMKDMKIDLNHVKDTADFNKEKINWVLYTAVGGVFVTVIAALITNLLMK